MYEPMMSTTIWGMAAIMQSGELGKKNKPAMQAKQQ